MADGPGKSLVCELAADVIPHTAPWRVVQLCRVQYCRCLDLPFTAKAAQRRAAVPHTRWSQLLLAPTS